MVASPIRLRQSHRDGDKRPQEQPCSLDPCNTARETEAEEVWLRQRYQFVWLTVLKSVSVPLLTWVYAFSLWTCCCLSFSFSLCQELVSVTTSVTVSVLAEFSVSAGHEQEQLSWVSSAAFTCAVKRGSRVSRHRGKKKTFPRFSARFVFPGVCVCVLCRVCGFCEEKWSGLSACIVRSYGVRLRLRAWKMPLPQIFTTTAEQAESLMKVRTFLTLQTWLRW